jgi:hypothetical protein
VLPLLVVFLARFHADHPERLFAAPEWAFGAAILFGQALVKFIVGLARGGEGAAGPVALTVALVVVFGLVPSLFVLNKTLEATESGVPVAVWLRNTQVVWFFLGAVTYLILGAIGETWHRANHAT